MNLQAETVPYWVRAEAAVVLAAAALSVVGAGIWIATIPRPTFGLTDLILPSCLTWLVLARFVARASFRRALMIGLLSPFLGSVFVVLLRIGPAQDFDYSKPWQLFGFLLYAFSYIGITAWTTLPVGALAGVVMHRIFHWWPPEPRENLQWTGLRSLYLRLLLSALPLLPLLILAFPAKPLAPRESMNAWRILAELYFFPLFVIRGVARMADWRFLLLPGVDAALRIAFAILVSSIVYRALTRRSA
jgi:hypothetical protein